VNVTLAPAQSTFEGEAAIDTLAGAVGVTNIVIVFEVAGLPLTHGRLEVILTLTSFPFVRDDVTYVLLFVPTGLPSTVHS
jgi:hypothetical protein